MDNVDPVFAAVVDELFGTAIDSNELAYEISKNSPDPSSVHVRGALQRKKREAQIGLANNAFGAAAGGVATAQAYKLARQATPEAMMATRAGRLMTKLPVSPKTAIAGAGVAAVGAQAFNGALDAQSANYFARELRGMRRKGEKSKIKSIKDKIIKAYADGSITRVQAESLTDRLAKAAANVVHDVTWGGDISKVDSDKRQVFGWASVTHVDGQPVVDRQLDFMPLDELEKSAYEYVIESRTAGDMHRRVNKGLLGQDQAFKAGEMIESMVVTPEKLKAMGLPGDSVNPGWWVGFKINDDDIWSKIKSGERRGFSVHGAGKRTPKETI
jgi:hypothetical protein